MIILIRRDPTKNINRWYAVGMQSTLFCQHAVLCGWGRRGSAYARWRILPVEDRVQAGEMVKSIVAAKIKKGYTITKGKNQATRFMYAKNSTPTTTVPSSSSS